MPNVSLSPVFNAQVVKDNGDPAVGWKIATYLAGSSTPQPAYTDSTGTVAHTNPIILDALGFVTMGELWIADGVAYKFVLSDANDVIKKTVDNIEGVNDSTQFSISQWLPPTVVPTYISANSFALADDQTTDFHVGRRLQAKQGVVFVYGRITSSVFASGVTTVTLQIDAPGTLNNGLTEVRLSLLRADHHALPKVALDLISLNVDGAVNAQTVNAQTINLTGALNQAPQVTLPSAATVDIGNAASSSILITGTTTISSFGVAAAGITRVVEFQSPLTLTYNATSLQIPGGASVAVQAGDVLVAYSKGAGNWKVIEYTRFTSAPGAASAIPTMQVFTSSGNFVVPPGVTRVKVTVVGGGGASATGDNSGYFFGGGAGGGTAIKTISGLTPGQVIPVTVGAGAPSLSANPGGTSSFGAFCSATGGQSGPQAGGVGVNGDLNIRGGVTTVSPIGTANTPTFISAPGGTFLAPAGATGSYGTGGQAQVLNSSPGNPGVVIVEY